MRLLICYIFCIVIGIVGGVMAGQGNALDNPNPVQEYRISNEDSAEPAYFGFTNKHGAWYIMRSSTAVNQTFYSYAAGTTTYNTNWTNRALLTYTTFYMSF